MNLAPALVEKDFWVTWTLGQIFSINAFRGNILFKGALAVKGVPR